jgi:hypothetical protein
MAGERTYPMLPCADRDDVLAFYVALGFTVTFQQRRPNPAAVWSWTTSRSTCSASTTSTRELLRQRRHHRR